MAEEHCKPGSVSAVSCPPAAGNPSSRAAVTGGLKRPDPKALDGPSSNAFLFGLAPDGVYQACGVAAAAGGLLPHHFTLTSFFWENRFFPKKAVSFLWHFPWGHPRFLLGTILPCGARTFLPLFPGIRGEAGDSPSFFGPAGVLSLLSQKFKIFSQVPTHQDRGSGCSAGSCSTPCCGRGC